MSLSSGSGHPESHNKGRRRSPSGVPASMIPSIEGLTSESRNRNRRRDRDHLLAQEGSEEYTLTRRLKVTEKSKVRLSLFYVSGLGIRLHIIVLPTIIAYDMLCI